MDLIGIVETLENKLYISSYIWELEKFQWSCYESKRAYIGKLRIGPFPPPPLPLTCTLRLNRIRLFSQLNSSLFYACVFIIT